MDDVDDGTLTNRWFRVWQWMGLYGLLLLIWTSWYLPAVVPFLQLALGSAVMCQFVLRLKLAWLRSGGLVGAAIRLLAAVLLQWWHLILLALLWEITTAITGYGSRVQADPTQFAGFALGLGMAFVKLPRRTAIAMMALGAFLPLAAEPAEACYHGPATAAPEMINFAAYFLFLSGTVRLVSYAAYRYLTEGLDEELAPVEKKVRRAVSPPADVARIGAPGARPARAPRRKPVRSGLPITLELERARCPICAAALTGKVVTCTDCSTPHHAECFAFTAACATYACGSRAAETIC